MKVTYNGRTYQVRWPKKFDVIILKVSLEYRQPNGYVQWKKADADGALKGLPKYLTYRDLSHRFTFLQFRETKEYEKKKIEYNEKNKGKFNGSPITKIKNALFKEILPEDLKKKHGWKPRTIWNDEQKQLLLNLVKIYRKSKLVINWETLVYDKRVNRLPYQDRFKLMKYYGQILKRKMTKKQINKKREDSLRYKYENYDEYLKGQSRRYSTVKNSVNEFLISQLPLR